MKKLGMGWLMFVLICLNSQFIFAEDQMDFQKYPSCRYCGMDREQFAYSRMLVTYMDGSAVGTCSIHCMAMELSLNLDKTPQSIQVGEFNKKTLIDADKAVWVIGGKMPGVMTKTGKWAFENKAGAESFIQTNGGKLGTFEDAMKASYEDMYSDSKMIRERRNMMNMDKK
jgi:copper chaperone NosL